MPLTAREFGYRWFEEVWNKQRREAIADLMAPGCPVHEASNTSYGPEGFYPFFDRMQAAFSDLRVRVEDVLAEGDRASIRWSCTMRHTGDGLGVPPCGKTIHVTGITIVHVTNGQAVEAWQNWDMLGLMEQIKDCDIHAATYLA